MRVLLIEDDISVAQSIELILQRLNVRISVADLGEQGIDLGWATFSSFAASVATEPCLQTCSFYPKLCNIAGRAS